MPWLRFTLDIRGSSLFLPQFGDSQQLRLVRILRSTVMVRVGGGWMALDEFLVKNDPCRGKEALTIRVVTLCKYVHLVLFSSIRTILGCTPEIIIILLINSNI